MENFVKAHPKTTVTLAAFIVYSLLEAFDKLGSVWSFFSGTPPYQWLTERWAGMTYEIYWWARIVIYCGMLILLVKILLTIRQQRKEEKEYESLRSTVTGLQKELTTAKDKLAAIEDQRPLLKTEPFSIQRTPRHHQYSGPHSLRDRIGEFALLRVTNEPLSLNSSAIAHRLYAKVSYCDEQWKELFPSVDGAWFSLSPIGGPFTIEPLHNKPDNLNPHVSTYLGIGLRYERNETRLHALSASSGNYPNWFNPDLALSRETTYIQVIIGCHDFQTTCYYVLTNHGFREKLQLEPIGPPA